MREEFLHYLWRLKRFDLSDLKTTEGTPIELIKVGDHNHHAGPDFTEARMVIGDTTWAGNVEIHLNSSDWYRHNHHLDAAYQNVILHVVLEEDEVVRLENGERLPCLELKKRIPAKLSGHYLKLVHNECWIPCEKSLLEVPDITKSLWYDRLLVERLEGKTDLIAQRLEQNQNDWEETFYQFLARSFGTKVNADPFEQLARSLPLKIINKHRRSLMQIEALLFGQAGLLEGNFEDDYPQRLQKEALFFRKKYGLQPMQKVQWKYLRMRPANFPSLRIAQLSSFLFSSTHLFSKILSAEHLKELTQLFDLKLSHYWYRHYRFDQHSTRRPKKLGITTIRSVIINTVIPFLFHYGKVRGTVKYQDKALQLMEQLKPEENHIITKWDNLGLKATSAAQSQALLQLKQFYCDKKRCLECAIGHSILSD